MLKDHDYFVSEYSEIKISLDELVAKSDPTESIETINLTSKTGREERQVSMTVKLTTNDEAEDYAHCLLLFDQSLDKLRNPIDRLIEILPIVVHSNKLSQNLSGDVFAHNISFCTFAQITGIFRYIVKDIDDQISIVVFSK